MRLPAALLALATALAALPAAAAAPPAPAGVPVAVPAPAGPAPAPVPVPVPVPVPSPAVAPAVAPAPVAAPVAPAPYPVRYVMPAPPWWALPVPVTERRSKALMATGIALWGAGAIASVAGAVIFIPSALSRCIADSFPGTSGSPKHRRGGGERLGTARQALGCGDTDMQTVGMATLTAGILGSLAGIPLFVIGNAKVPVRPGADSSLLPSLRVGAGSARLSWTF
jgi:hypothetical protein